MYLERKLAVSECGGAFETFLFWMYRNSELKGGRSGLNLIVNFAIYFVPESINRTGRYLDAS